MSRIAGRLALITGASSGIGAACARRFARDGARLVLWARRLERLEALAAELHSAHGTDVRVAGVDVRDRGQVDAAARALDAAPDILVNNAGLAAGLDPLHVGDPDDWERMIDTNLKGLLWVSRAILPGMIARGTGHIVNLGSTAGRWVYPRGNVYNATKFGVRALTEAMNLDVAGTGIRVSGVEPGHTETEFAEVRFAGDRERAKATYRGFTPLTGDDIADVIAYVVNLPPHVNILNVLVMPSAQRSMHVIDRTET
jgi:NADP-dependent 3-hydroxy acid dehydrogenase YdfG